MEAGWWWEGGEGSEESAVMACGIKLDWTTDYIHTRVYTMSDVIKNMNFKKRNNYMSCLTRYV